MMTNSDKLRTMWDSDLAKMISSDWCEIVCGSPVSCDGDCDKKILIWLKQEAKEGET